MKTKIAKEIPLKLEDRKNIWHKAIGLIHEMHHDKPLSKEELLDASSKVLKDLNLSDEHQGYAMVMLNNAFWMNDFFSIPIENRLLFLPKCLINLDAVSKKVEELKYKYFIAEGTPIVVKVLSEKNAKAFVGVSCLDSLEKAFMKVSQIGVPSIAIPLNGHGCKGTDVDLDYLLWFLEKCTAKKELGIKEDRNFLDLLRSTYNMFEEEEFDQILGEYSNETKHTENYNIIKITKDWIKLAGKRLRPFFCLAGYRAYTEGNDFPLSVKRVAMTIEVFHKASLIHDDLQDNDENRYGVNTIYKKYGAAAAINMGDYLIGLGYYLAGTISEDFGPDVCSNLIRLYTETHLEVTIGQGMEFEWRRDKSRKGEMTLAECIKLYKLKTSPAFEAALGSGLVLVKKYEQNKELVKFFSANIGTAFQIQNDFEAWEADLKEVRATVLISIALEHCTDKEKNILLTPENMEKKLNIFKKYDVLNEGKRLLMKFRQNAWDAAVKQENKKFSNLLKFLVETIVKPVEINE